jgi:hypothetical protein
VAAIKKQLGLRGLRGTEERYPTTSAGLASIGLLFVCPFQFRGRLKDSTYGSR